MTIIPRTLPRIISARLRRLRRDERGIALVVALVALVVLGIAVVSIISYTTSNQKSTNLDQAEIQARNNAEAAMQQAYSVLQWAAAGKNSDGMGADNSALLSGDHCVGVVATCPSSTAQETVGTGSYNGTWAKDSGSDTGTWTITTIGWSRNAAASDVVNKTLTATVSITSGDPGLPGGSVWNYLFSSAPPSTSCDLDVDGQNVKIDVPLFVTGNFCMSGSNAGVLEDIQAVDLMVEGKTVFSGGGNYVGSSSAPITSGVSVGGCATSVTDTGSDCSGYDWHVKTTDVPPSDVPQPPEPDFVDAYSTAGVGPTYGCATSSSGGIGQSSFDNNTSRDNSAADFNLTPSTSYSCVSVITNSDNTTSRSELSWDNSTKTLTVDGNIFFDGSAYISQQAKYVGVANLYLSGTLYFSGQTSGLCATDVSSQKPYCDMTGAWQTSQSMLLVMPDDMAGIQKAVQLDGQNNFLQAGILAPSTATISLGGNNVNYQGPMIGGKYTWGNNVNVHPLPPVTNLPPGAPVDPNTSVTVGSLSYQ